MEDVKEIKATAELKLPEKVDENVGKACRDLSQTVKKVASPVSKIAELYLIKAPCTLLAPVAAYLRGKSYEIACKYLPFQNQIEMRKELSQIKMAQCVLENLADKEQRGEELPSKIEDTDTLFSIQNAASETTDEDFIRLWAELYTKEACKPNTVSKKTINLCRDLDKEVVKILENDIFPYCDNSSTFFWGIKSTPIDKISIAEDYGFLSRKGIEIGSSYLNELYCLDFINYKVYVHAGYSIQSYFPSFSLTPAGLEIKKCLKIGTNEEKILGVIEDMKKASTELWHPINRDNIKIKLKNGNTSQPLFIVTDNAKKVIYPPNYTSLSVNDFLINSLLEVEEVK